MLLTDRDTNKVYFSRLIQDFTCYHSIVEKLDRHNIAHQTLSHTKDYWVRDFMPIQASEKEFIQYEYNPDYLQNEIDYITNPTTCCKSLGVKTKYLNLIIDGGNVIKCTDCIIMTDKVFIENSNYSKSQLINKLETYFGCQVFFIPWDRNEVYGHADGMVRHIEGNEILLNSYRDYDKTFRNKVVKVLQTRFNIVELSYKLSKPSIYNWAYINYLQVGNLILLPELGIEEDKQALEQFHTIFPNQQIEQIDCSEIVPLGGALNCISWQIKY